MKERKKFSIVVPIYYNELNIPHTIPRLQALQRVLPDYDFEYIFVDDGSQDKSLQLLLEARKSDSRVKVVKLSKNNGSMAAVQAGLTVAHGGIHPTDWVIIGLFAGYFLITAWSMLATMLIFSVVVGGLVAAFPFLAPFAFVLMIILFFMDTWWQQQQDWQLHHHH